MRFASAAVLIVTTSCASADAAAPPFRAVGPVARVVVTLNYGRDSLPPITDPARIRAIVGFVDARAAGWKIPWAGVPVVSVDAGFFRGATDRGAVHYFGAGRETFVASSRPGDFASRPATRREVAEFMRLIGTPGDAAAAP